MEQSMGQPSVVRGTSRAIMEHIVSQSSVIRGTSRAIVAIVGEQAYKFSADVRVIGRIVEQGHYMQRIGYPFPSVSDVVNGCGYAMDALRPLDTREKSLRDLIGAGTSAVATLWAKEQIMLRKPEASAHEGMLHSLCTANGTLSALPALLADWREFCNMDVSHGCTHGDATLDNMLLDQYGRVRLIDPIPPDARIGPWLAQDIAKLIQSARGYECIKYGYAHWPAPMGGEENRALRMLHRPEDHAFARYLFAVSMLRMLPYVPENDARHFFARDIVLCYSRLT